jgi:uncharacterized membrane protein YkvA (DUF1232 family)
MANINFVPMKLITTLKERAKQLKTQTYTMYLACKHPNTPWYAKALLILVIGYAVSPIDLIPDFIPVLGYVDDLIIVPLGISLALKMIPKEVMLECREAAKAERVTGKIKWVGLSVIIFTWLVILSVISIVIYKTVSQK